MAAISLGLGDYAVIGGMLIALGGLMTTVMMSNVKTLATRIERAETQIDRVDDRVAKVEKAKADKHEWARETLLARSKMEKLSGQIGRVDAKLDANFGIAASVRQLADEIVRLGQAKAAELARLREVKTDGG